MRCMRSASCVMEAGARGEVERAGRKRMQAEGDLCDDAECAEGAGEKFGEIVAGDVLDDLAAAARDGAVGEDDGHAEDEIAERAVAAAKNSAVVRGDDAADRGAIGEDGIERDTLVVARELALHGGPRCAGGDGGGHVLPNVLADAGEARGRELEARSDARAPGELGAAAGGFDGE